MNRYGKSALEAQARKAEVEMTEMIVRIEEFRKLWNRARHYYRKRDIKNLARIVYDASGLIEERSNQGSEYLDLSNNPRLIRRCSLTISLDRECTSEFRAAMKALNSQP